MKPRTCTLQVGEKPKINLEPKFKIDPMNRIKLQDKPGLLYFGSDIGNVAMKRTSNPWFRSFFGVHWTRRYPISDDVFTVRSPNSQCWNCRWSQPQSARKVVTWDYEFLSQINMDVSACELLWGGLWARILVRFCRLWALMPKKVPEKRICGGTWQQLPDSPCLFWFLLCLYTNLKNRNRPMSQFCLSQVTSSHVLGVNFSDVARPHPKKFRSRLFAKPPLFRFFTLLTYFSPGEPQHRTVPNSHTPASSHRAFLLPTDFSPYRSCVSLLWLQQNWSFYQNPGVDN